MSAICEACKHPVANHNGVGGCQMPWCSCRVEYSIPPAPREPGVDAPAGPITAQWVDRAHSAAWDEIRRDFNRETMAEHLNRYVALATPTATPTDDDGKTSTRKLCEYIVNSQDRIAAYRELRGPLVLIENSARSLARLCRIVSERILAGGVTNDDLAPLRVPAAPVHHAHCPLAGQPIRFESCCQPAAPVSGEPTWDERRLRVRLSPIVCDALNRGENMGRGRIDGPWNPEPFLDAIIRLFREVAAAPSGGSEVSEAWSAWASTVEHIVEGLSSDHLRAPLSNQALEHIDNYVARLTNLAAALRAGGPTP